MSKIKESGLQIPDLMTPRTSNVEYEDLSLNLLIPFVINPFILNLET